MIPQRAQRRPMTAAAALAIAAGVRATSAGNRFRARTGREHIAGKLGEMAAAAAQRGADTATLSALAKLANAAAVGAEVHTDVANALAQPLPNAVKIAGHRLRERAGVIDTTLRALLRQSGRFTVTSDFYASVAQLKNDAAMWLQRASWSVNR